MSRSVTISACGFGRERGTRRGRDACAGGAVSAGAGGAVASSHQTTLSASQTSMRTRVAVPARFTDTVWPGWPVALTALVTSSETRSPALSTKEFSPHSHRTCLTCRQAQDAAVDRAPSSRELWSGHGSVIACYLPPIGDVART